MEKKTYKENFDELTSIIRDLERGDINIDDIIVSIKKASLLLEECKKALKEVDEDVDKITLELSNSN
ncbi:MAG: exodeoxyribonuclease VII small subunit [Bacteroidales bacterium]|jgi:exodeoxyribonuclease VII small subunit|nr:exodeoxyribonuclease VII small subunit [Bacteroidales bacterium]